MEEGPNRANTESGQFTLYIPKNQTDDGSKTLIRRRRTSSKKRSSSKRKQDRETLSDLLCDEDNHLLPSLRIQRRARMKSLKGKEILTNTCVLYVVYYIKVIKTRKID